MTPEAQRIAIAEACGWTHLTQFTNRITNPDGHAIFFDPTKQDKLSLIPDYLNNLNAMHEAEKVLTNESMRRIYKAHLIDLVFSDPPNNRGIVFATAAQRAESFLRTLNLWQP